MKRKRPEWVTILKSNRKSTIGQATFRPPYKPHKKVYCLKGNELSIAKRVTLEQVRAQSFLRGISDFINIPTNPNGILVRRGLI